MKNPRLFFGIILIFIIGAVSAAAMEVDDVTIRGFISQGYLYSTDNQFLAETKQGTFQFNEMGINFSAFPAEKLRLGIQLFCRDLGDFGDNEVTLDWAFADYRWKDWLGIRAGRIKMPVGFYNETRDIDSVRTSILLPQSVYPERYRENILALQGGAFYGDLLFAGIGNFSYQFLYGSSDIDENGAAAKELNEIGLFRATDFKVNDAWVAALKWETPLSGLRIGASMMKVKLDIETETIVPLGPLPIGAEMTMEVIDYIWTNYSLEYAFDDLIFSAEYVEVTNRNQVRYNSALVVPENEIETEGFYAGISYRFLPRFEIGSYYSIYYPNKKNRKGDGMEPSHRAWLKDFALTLRFDIDENWNVKIEGHSMNGTAMVKQPEDKNDLEKDWYLFAAKLSFMF